MISERTKVNFDGDTFLKYEKRKYNNNNYLQLDSEMEFSSFNPVPIGEALAMIENKVYFADDNDEDILQEKETIQSLNLAEKMSGKSMSTPSDLTRSASLGDTTVQNIMSGQSRISSDMISNALVDQADLERKEKAEAAAAEKLRK